MVCLQECIIIINTKNNNNNSTSSSIIIIIIITVEWVILSMLATVAPWEICQEPPLANAHTHTYMQTGLEAHVLPFTFRLEGVSAPRPASFILLSLCWTCMSRDGKMSSFEFTHEQPELWINASAFALPDHISYWLFPAHEIIRRNSSVWSWQR